LGQHYKTRQLWRPTLGAFYFLDIITFMKIKRIQK